MPSTRSLAVWSLSLLAAAAASLTSTGPPRPACNKIQFDFPAGTGANADRASAVKEMYREAWNAYAKYAFGADELQPLSRNRSDGLFSWGASIVDGIDTAVVMNLTDVVERQLAFISTVDFSKTGFKKIELLDASIRYLGGLLSAYDLIKSGRFYTGYNTTQVDKLLSQAVVLADKLAYAWTTPSGINSAYVSWRNNSPVEATYRTKDDNVTHNATNTASAGSYLIEWYRLADLTGNETYRKLVDRGEKFLVEPQPAPTYPGLVGSQFDTKTGRMLNFAGGWHAEVDSFLEYLIKIRSYVADELTGQYAKFWLSAAESTAQHLALHPHGFPDLTFVSEMNETGQLTYTMDDYSCFAGGSFLLGCKLLNQSNLCDVGKAIADGCHTTYNTTTTGLGGFYWGWYDADTNTFPPDKTVDVDSGYRGQGAKDGYFLVSGGEGWGQFPESVESWFYAHRVTGEPRWAEYVWDMFLAVNTTGRNEVAFSPVNNVDMPFGSSQGDGMFSFFFAEVLKYMYLTFSEPDVVNLDEYVFNTEAHPVRAQCGS